MHNTAPGSNKYNRGFRGGLGKYCTVGVSRSEIFLEKAEKHDAENSGGDTDLSPARENRYCRKKAAGFPQPSFRDCPFLYPVFAIVTGVLKHLLIPVFTEPPSNKGCALPCSVQ